jgi:hypothetical protein
MRKPKYGDTYYLISLNHGMEPMVREFLWVDSLFDENNYRIGNYFKTRAAANEVVKNLLILLNT